MPTHYKGTQALVEAPTSPEWLFGENIAVTRSFSGPYSVCLSSAPFRGAAGTGIVAGYVVTESRVRRQRGGLGELVIQYGLPGGVVPGDGAQLPPDEAEIQNEKLERALAKHPRYSSLTEVLLNHINVLLETSDDGKRATALAAVTASVLALELYQKLKRGETHYLIYAPVYRLVLHSWTAPGALSSGGFRQTPPSAPILPPGDNQWLREGDRATFNGTTWQVEKKWIGVPEWDADIYP